MLVGLRSIPLGAKDITDDIACAFGVQRREAERMKCRFGSAMTSPRDNHEMVEATPIGGDDGGEPLRITHAQLITVIRQRTEADHQRDRDGAQGTWLQRPGRAAGGADRRRGRAQEYRRLYAGRARPRGPRRPAARRSPACLKRTADPAFSTLVGLAMLAGSGSGDIRDLAMGSGKERKPRDRHVRPPDRGDAGRVLARRCSC